MKNNKNLLKKLNKILLSSLFLYKYSKWGVLENLLKGVKENLRFMYGDTAEPDVTSSLNYYEICCSFT